MEDVGGGFGGLSDTKRSTAVARMWSNTRCHVDADSKQGVTSPLQTHTPRTCNDCQRCPEAYVCIEKFPFSHHFKVLEILPDVVLGLTWLQSYNPIVNWEERYADVRHPSTSYKLSLDGSKESTRLHLHATSKSSVLSTLSTSTSKVAAVESPKTAVTEHLDLHISTYNKSEADAPNDFSTETGVTDEQCSNIKIQYISLPKLKQEIHRPDLTGDRMYPCCMPRPAVPVNDEHSMQSKKDDGNGLDQVRQRLPTQIHKWASLYDREQAEFEELPPN